MLKNAKTQFTAENEEISTYLALEVFATKVGDAETAKLARDIRKEEQRMAKFLEGQIRKLAGATALDEVPASQRRTARNAKRRKNARRRETERKAAPKKARPKPKKAPAKKRRETREIETRREIENNRRRRRPRRVAAPRPCERMPKR